MSSVGRGDVCVQADERSVGFGSVPVLGGGRPEAPWRDGEEGQGGGVHEGDAGTAHVWLQQRRGADPPDARGGQVCCLQRAGGPGPERRSETQQTSYVGIKLQSDV